MLVAIALALVTGQIRPAIALAVYGFRVLAVMLGAMVHYGVQGIGGASLTDFTKMVTVVTVFVIRATVRLRRGRVAVPDTGRSASLIP